MTEMLRCAQHDVRVFYHELHLWKKRRMFFTNPSQVSVTLLAKIFKGKKNESQNYFTDCGRRIQ